MSLERLLKQQVTIEHREVTDTNGDGDDVLEVTSTETDVDAFLTRAPFGRGLFGDEHTADRETYVTDWMLVLNADAVIGPRDRVTFGDQAFEVDGQPHRVWNPRLGQEHHVEVRLVETVG